MNDRSLLLSEATKTPAAPQGALAWLAATLVALFAVGTALTVVLLTTAAFAR